MGCSIQASYFFFIGYGNQWSNKPPVALSRLVGFNVFLCYIYNANKILKINWNPLIWKSFTWQICDFFYHEFYVNPKFEQFSFQEAHNMTDYVNNLEDIKRRLLDTGATVGFVLSTPVTYDKSKDDLIRKYNHAAKK